MTDIKQRLFATVRATRKRLKWVGLAFITAVAFVPLSAHAHDDIVLTPATCMPDEVNLASPATYAVAYGGVTFASGKVGTVTLRCNLINRIDGGGNPAWINAAVEFEDSSVAAGNGVYVYLHQVELATGTDVTEQVLNSDLWDPTGRIYIGYILKATIDYTKYYYFIEIQLQRTAPWASEAVYRVTFY